MTDSLVAERVEPFEVGEGVTAKGKIPKDAEFFQDHFPKFPVLPGVLAIEILKRAAEAFLDSKKPNQSWALKEIKDVKFSAYLKPGDTWEARVELLEEGDHQVRLRGKLFHESRTAATVQMILESTPIGANELLS